MGSPGNPASGNATAPPSTPDDYAVSLAMKAMGGSFVQQLGRLCDYADRDNIARIKATWPEYWAEYSDLAKRQAERGPEVVK
jgi:hypothetical protein